MDYRISTVKKIRDTRGDLIVFLALKDLSCSRKKFGQIYFVTFGRRGAVRGNHYHRRWHEWFGIVTGKVRVRLCDVRTNEKKTFILSATQRHFLRLEVGPYVAHSFESMSDYAALINYGDEEWSADDRVEHKVDRR